jgi:hypothetical protein
MATKKRSDNVFVLENYHKDVLFRLDVLASIQSESIIASLRLQYMTVIVDAVNNYYSGDRESATDEYFAALLLARIPNLINDKIRSASLANPDNQQLHMLNSDPLKMKVVASNISICSCGAQMSVRNTSEYKCMECNTVSDVTSTSDMRREITPNNICKFDDLWSRTLGVDKWVPTDKEKALIAEVVNKYYKPIEITPAIMREILHNLNANNHNMNILYKHVSTLVRMFGVYAPPEFTFDETRRIRIKYNAIDDALKSLSMKINASFILAKIIEDEFDDPEKLKVLPFIAQKALSTTNKYEHNYAILCKKRSNLVNRYRRGFLYAFV